MILYKQRLGFLFAFIFLVTSNLFGQDAHYSQFYANPLYINPAFSGTANCPRFNLNFRDQWPSIPGNFLNFSASYDQHIHSIYSGIGAIVSADIEGGGILQTYNAGAIYNFRVQAARQLNFQFALQGGFLGTSLNWNKLECASDKLGNWAQNDFPKDLDNGLVKSQFDAAFGFVGYMPFLYFGMAIHHLFPIQKSFFNTSATKYKTEWVPKWTAHIGGKITLKQKIKDEESFGDLFLYPNLIFTSQGNFSFLHEGMYLKIYPFTIGGWLRHNFKNVDAFIFSCGLEYKSFRFGYSYDFNLTQLERTGGSHEVSLQFIIPCDNELSKKIQQKRKYRTSSIDCPCY
jgi:type IX secretion system PorP/SprF family membrane protein